MPFYNVDMDPLKNPSNFRKLSMGNWDNIGDPQVYAQINLDCRQVLQYLDELNQKSDTKVTVNHIFGRVVALTLRKFPNINGLISRGKIYIRNRVNIFFQVSIEDAETELVGVCLNDADKKGVVEMAKELRAMAKKVRESKDHPIRKSQSLFKFVPWRVMPYLIKFLNWIQYDLNINLSFLGIPRDPLGSLMITAIGSLGFEAGFVPLTHLGRNPAQLALGKITDKVVVENGEMVIRPLIGVCCTFDHRFMDGLVGAKMMKYIKDLFENILSHKELIEEKVD